jgi:hypothetical protein
MAAKNPHRSGNPATRATTPAQSPRSGEGRFRSISRALLVRLAGLPSYTVPGAMLVLMVVGLSAPLPLAVPALVIAGLFVLWLAYLSWTVIDAKGRLLRGVMIGLVVGALIGRITGFL